MLSKVDVEVRLLAFDVDNHEGVEGWLDGERPKIDALLAAHPGGRRRPRAASSSSSRHELGRAWVDALAAAGATDVAYHASVVHAVYSFFAPKHIARPARLRNVSGISDPAAAMCSPRCWAVASSESWSRTSTNACASK
jgi:hypothetical protein